MFAFAFAFALASADPVGLVAGEPAPYDGVLLDPDRAGELVVAESRAAALALQLRDEQQLRDAWKAAATRDWTESPELHRWMGFGAGVVVTVGAILLGAWAVDTAAGG